MHMSYLGQLVHGHYEPKVYTTNSNEPVLERYLQSGDVPVSYLMMLAQSCSV